MISDGCQTILGLPAKRERNIYMFYLKISGVLIYNECTVGLRFASLIFAVTSYRQEIRTFTLTSC